MFYKDGFYLNLILPPSIFPFAFVIHISRNSDLAAQLLADSQTYQNTIPQIFVIFKAGKLNDNLECRERFYLELEMIYSGRKNSLDYVLGLKLP